MNFRIIKNHNYVSVKRDLKYLPEDQKYPTVNKSRVIHLAKKKVQAYNNQN